MRRAAAAVMATTALAAAAAQGLAPIAATGDAVRGKAIVTARETNCILCHEVPDSGAAAMGNVGPPLGGVGARLSPAELRLRIVDSTRVNPASLMPSYHRVEGLNRVPPGLRGKPVLSAQQVEDVVAYLGTLK